MNPGIYPGLDYPAYEKLGGLRSSQLWPLVRGTPADYWERMSNPPAATPAMAFGSAFHAFILEPEKFAREYVIGGPMNPTTGKAYGRDTKAWAKWEEEHPGIKVVSLEDHYTMGQMRDSLYQHDTAPVLLSEARQSEVSIVWQDEEMPWFALQGRLDILFEIQVSFADLKTTDCVAPHSFSRSCEEYGYFSQMAMYFDGLRELKDEQPYAPQVIAVEKTPPYKAAVYEIDEEDLEHGRAQYRHALSRLQWCKTNCKFPGYPGIMRLQPPRWAKKEPFTVIE